jgi:Raf kinase inhibitor-like YbhB/YbcL family protein
MKKILAIAFLGALIGALIMAGTSAFDIRSSLVFNGMFMGSDITCDGENSSPDLSWSDVPPEAKSLALILHDPDAPHKNGFYHWIVVDIPASTVGIAAGRKFSAPARELLNDAGKRGYVGPCPPKESGEHHYHFALYALDVEKISLPPDATSYEIDLIVRSHAIAQTEIIGLYRRN